MISDKEIWQCLQSPVNQPATNLVLPHHLNHTTPHKVYSLPARESYAGLARGPESVVLRLSVGRAPGRGDKERVTSE